MNRNIPSNKIRVLVPLIDDSVPLISPKTVDGVIILHVWHLGARQGKEVPFENATPLLCSTRFSLAIIMFFGFMNQYALRVNMSVAIVCMTQQPKKDESCQNDTSSRDNTEDCQRNSTYDGHYDWDKKTQGLVLGSFFWGYILTLFAGGWLAGRYGGKHMIGWCTMGCGVATFFMPIGAQLHVSLLIALRVIAGIFQGVVLPATSVMLANWAPPLERSKLCGIGYAGAQIGNVITFPLSGVLCTHGFAGGWPSIFYIFGIVCILWSVGWLLLVYDSPVLHPRISPEEREYIVDSLKSNIDVTKKSTATPWRQIFTSRPFWAIFVTHTCGDWGQWTFFTNISSFMNDVLVFQVEKAGFLSALPYIGFWAMTNVSGLLADFLRSRRYATTITVRRLFNSLGNIVPAVFVLMAGFTENIYAVISFLTIGIAMIGCQHGGGYLVNPLDIAPRYAGIIIGISNSAGTFSGILAPLLIGILTPDGTREQWQYVFIMTACILTFGAVFYIIFASGDIQPWALEGEGKTDIEISTISVEERDTVFVEKHDSIECTNL